MRFADTRRTPDDGRKYLNKSAGQIMAEMFARSGAVRLPPGYGSGKDKNRSPMSLRWQAAFRAIKNEYRLEAFTARQSKRRSPRQSSGAR